MKFVKAFALVQQKILRIVDTILIEYLWNLVWI